MKQALKRAVLSLPTPLLRRIVVARRQASHPEEIAQVVEVFCGKSNLPSSERSKLERAIQGDMRNHLITPDEYFLYDFASKTEAEKHEFVGDLERTVLCARLYNSNPAGMVFMDKMKTYESFQQYFKREVVQVKSEADFEAFKQFVLRHDHYMAKPVAASRGNGIRKEASPRTEEEVRAAFKALLEAGACVVEELIDQDQRIAQLHPQSVNTIRYATYLNGEQLHTIACFIKIGRGESVVDNGGAGGFLAAIDEATGKITTPGKTEYGEVIEVHPDTGIPLVGFQISEWEELLKLVKELPTVLPEQKYVGWDLALSETKGWVLVEGNSGGQFVGPQISKGQGIRSLVDETFGSM